MAAENHTPIVALESERELIGNDRDALYRIGNILKLAAFAAEARRTLDAVDGAIPYFKDAEKHLHETVTAWRNWTVMEDTVGDVLNDVAREVGELVERMDNRDSHLKRLAEAL